MKRIYLHTVAAMAVGYSHGRTETVMVSGGRGKDPIRTNKADFDADQAGPKNMSLYQGEDHVPPAPTSGNRSTVNATHEGEDGEVLTTAAPSAPDFSRGEGETLLMDESKQAVAPASTTADQLVVMKVGSGKNAKFVIADGMGKAVTGDQAKLLGIDEDGYKTEEAARKVQTHINPVSVPAADD